MSERWKQEVSVDAGVVATLTAERDRYRAALERIRDLPGFHGKRPEHRTANVMRAIATEALEGE